jgi:predicted alpha/beta superfamily hydrolase
VAVWQDYVEHAAPGEHTVTGAVKVLADLWSPQLENARDIFIYLPPGYAVGAARRYPVLYMHDGQNLFDNATSYAGEWHVDETLETLSAEGIEAIVVGIPNMGDLRLAEYTPFQDPRGGGGNGERYVTFIAETLKPIIDADFRTLRDREHTGIGGSSLGGLISVYAIFRFPSVFGQCAALSPALGGAGGRIFDYVEKAEPARGKVYMDVGMREAWHVRSSGRSPGYSLTYLETVRRMYRLLIEKGYVTGATLLYVEDEDGIHQESAWARRLPGALRFLLGPEGPG